MSDEQQHEGGRKPQTSHASKSHAPKSSRGRAAMGGWP